MKQVEKMDWIETINKVTKTGTSRTITIPVTMAGDMQITEGDYVKLQYDEKQKTITIRKVV